MNARQIRDVSDRVDQEGFDCSEVWFAEGSPGYIRDWTGEWSSTPIAPPAEREG